ncbi:hypothetical protein [Desulfurobacterium indicum]|uniref:Sulfotransferase domain-containing protein n=1 Tax=Desulfurobacterium indicum TaxID=1914305 RepID=A0A1R1ML13_9BACT|nr:hypothetical protein [Desulfurobacterium indicum]OMH40456.1 hypothetical protein BLW93_05180 [Desulfurobacterium indicum]
MIELDSKAEVLIEKIKGKRFFKRLLKRLGEKRLIFTVTTGRSGTAYFTNLLSSFNIVASFHEPEPDFVNVMRKVQEFPEEAVRFLFSKKLPFIASIDKPIYCETSHLFCKGFFYPLLELGVLPELIILKRDKRLVAKSLFELNTIPGRTKLGLMYYLKPNDRVYLPISNWHRLHDYQLCYWYCLEIEKRMAIYSKEVLFRKGKIYTIKFEDLLDFDSVIRIFGDMGLSVNETTLAILKNRFGVPVNTKRSYKVRELARELSEETVREMEKEVEEMVEIGGYDGQTG